MMYFLLLLRLSSLLWPQAVHLDEEITEARLAEPTDTDGLLPEIILVVKGIHRLN